jgi:hypothetical protein
MPYIPAPQSHANLPGCARRQQSVHEIPTFVVAGVNSFVGEFPFGVLERSAKLRMILRKFKLFAFFVQIMQICENCIAKSAG